MVSRRYALLVLALMLEVEMPKTTMNSIVDHAESVSVRRLAASRRPMTMKRAFPLPQILKRPLVFAMLGTLLAFYIGGALADRIEKHAAEDRLSVGMAAEVCVHASCAG
jgi:hypothetical protein